MKNPGRVGSDGRPGLPSSGRRCRHPGREDYGFDITNDATLKQIAAFKAQANRGTHNWRYGHMGRVLLRVGFFWVVRIAAGALS
jgi:hypothetical protein